MLWVSCQAFPCRSLLRMVLQKRYVCCTILHTEAIGIYTEGTRIVDANPLWYCIQPCRSTSSCTSRAEHTCTHTGVCRCVLPMKCSRKCFAMPECNTKLALRCKRQHIGVLLQERLCLSLVSADLHGAFIYEHRLALTCCCTACQASIWCHPQAN